VITRTCRCARPAAAATPPQAATCGRRSAERLERARVVRDDGTVVLEGDAVCYTMPIAKP
jgi:hypothetical protein